MLGFDYSAGPIPPQTLKDYGALVALRYVTPGYPGKTLTESEVHDLRADGISIVALWETTKDRMLGGNAAGAEDGRSAEMAMTLLGFPNDAVCYFAADWDVQPDQVGLCLDYLGAAAVQMGGQAQTGGYGGLLAVKAMADAGYKTIQTDAWSAGEWDPRALARQTGQQLSVAGVPVDVNDIVDYSALGAWDGETTVTTQTSTIPASIVDRWPFLANDFPAGATWEMMNGLIWADAGARAAAVFAERAAAQAGLASTQAQAAGSSAANAATSAAQAVDIAQRALAQAQANGTALSAILARLNVMGVPAPAETTTAQVPAQPSP